MTLAMGRRVSLLTAFAVATALWAQPQSLKFDRLLPENGLSQNSATAILHDSQGFMWFGTQDGLNRYDGYRLTVYQRKTDDPHSLSDSYVASLYEDRNGVIWVGSNGGGLNRFDRAANRFSHYRHDSEDPNTLSSDVVHAICQDSEGRLWTGTDNGLNRLDPETGKIVRYQGVRGDPHTLSNNQVRAVVEDRSGYLWIGTSNGLNRFDRGTGRFRRFLHDPENPKSLSNNFIRKVLTVAGDPHGYIWAASFDGLNRYDPETGEFRAFRFDQGRSNPGRYNQVFSIDTDDDGLFWLGTTNGLVIFNPKTEQFRRYTHNSLDPRSLSGNFILSIYRDRAGDMWVSSAAASVGRYSKNSDKFGHIRALPGTPDSLSHNLVTTFCEDSEGRVWVGTWEGGLNRYDPERGRFLQFHHDPEDPTSISGERIMAMHRDRAGQLWIGTANPALNRLRPDGVSFDRVPIALDDAPSRPIAVMEILGDGGDGLWLGTTQVGLVWFDPSGGVAKSYRYQRDNPASISHDVLFSLAHGRDGRLWIGTNGGGLNRFDPETETFERFRHSEDPASISGNRVRVVVRTDKGVLWAGTDRGLNRYLPESEGFARYGVEDGLPNNVVYGIVEDGHERLWISTNKGLSRFDPATGAFRNFDVHDGLQNNEFNTGSYYKDARGWLYFGGVGGFNRFVPDEITENKNPPPVVLTSITVLDRPIEEIVNRSASALESVTLSHRDNFLTLEFAALDYVTPAKNRYAYKMEGVDRDWIQAGSRRQAFYTNLAPGAYTFRVKGSNNDGVWNEEGLSLDIRIHPPFWRSTWFRALMITLAALLLIAAHQLRVRAVAKQKRRLASLVLERTTELRAKNTALRQSHTQVSETVERLESEIRDRQKAERALREAKEAAESASRIKSEFLATMSHEIRTPMNGVIGMTELLSVDASLNKEQRECVDAIKVSGETLLTLINDILNLSKIEAGALELERLNFELAVCLEDSLQVVAAQAFAKGLDINYAIEPDVPAFVYGDAVRLKQVLVNLLGNAVKFTHQGGVFARVVVEGDPDESSVCLRFDVRDTGIGIEEDKRERLFQMFSQLDSSTTRRYGGTGLGLAISKKLIQLMGGEISVVSKPGKGSTFSFTARLEPAPARPRDYLQAGVLRGLRVLAVEPSPHTRHLVEIVLAQWGVNHHAVAGAEEALAHIEDQTDYDVYLVASELPDMKADELRDRIRERDNGARVIVMYTELTRDQKRRFDGAVAKPLRRETLLQALRREPAKAAAAPMAGLVPGSPLDPMRLLLVEDNRINQKLALRMLKKLGCRVDLAGNGLQALEALRNDDYDLVFMDLQMPVMDGFEATRRIVAEWPEKDRPKIVAMTANAMPGDRERCLDAGMDDYISKPIAFKRLRAVLERFSLAKTTSVG